jgi:endoglucanase Acf2
MSLLRGGQAVNDPEMSYRCFSSEGFKKILLMDGDSRAYYLMYSAIFAEI